MYNIEHEHLKYSHKKKSIKNSIEINLITLRSYTRFEDIKLISILEFSFCIYFRADDLLTNKNSGEWKSFIFGEKIDILCALTG